MSKCTINKITDITLFKYLRYISDRAWCVMCNWKSKSLPFHNSLACLIYIYVILSFKIGRFTAIKV